MDDLKLTGEKLDILREIGNIGGGNAATALSQLIGKQVSVTVPQAKLIPINEIINLELASKPHEVSIAVSLRILGKLRGGILVFFPTESALPLIDILMHRTIGTTEVFNLIDESALSETAHILCSSYLNAVGQFLNLHQLIPSLTEVFVDRVDKLSKAMVKKFIPENINFIVPIENHLAIDDIKFNLFVIFLLDPESLSKVLAAVGL